jgi:hypothetical protein
MLLLNTFGRFCRFFRFNQLCELSAAHPGPSTQRLLHQLFRNLREDFFYGHNAKANNSLRLFLFRLFLRFFFGHLTQVFHMKGGLSAVR